METLQHENHSGAPEMMPTNTTTKTDLLRRAKDAIDAGAQCLQEAAEALALAHENFKATQREIAEAIGRSASWVNRLLKWRQSGYKERSPFGPTTTAGRVSHAKQRTRKSKPRNDAVESEATSDDEEASADKRTAEYARLEAEGEAEPTTATPSTHAQSSTSRKPYPEKAKGELRYAIDHWWPDLDDAGKSEITAYFLKKAGVRVS
jgi:hypothetical protein